MSNHLSMTTLNALVDGELPADQLAQVNEHLAACSLCASQALQQSLMKIAVAKAGHRHEMPQTLRSRMMMLAQKETLAAQDKYALPSHGSSHFGSWGWIAAGLLFVASMSGFAVYRHAEQEQISIVQQGSLIGEVFDQHIASLAASTPQVLSTDRHTVKPWFQGKIPFSFNLPSTLPSGMTLDGANLAYLEGKPAAQLLFSIGKHRVSLFVRKRTAADAARESSVELSGFHAILFESEGLNMIALSDAEPARLAELMEAMRQAQANPLPH